MRITGLEQQILAAVEGWGGRGATYVIRNTLHDFGKGPNLKTAQVLRRLKSLETAGLVERAPSSYVVQLCWSVTGAGREVLARQRRAAS